LRHPAPGSTALVRVNGGDDEQRSIRCPEAGAYFTDEIGVPRGIDQVHVHVVDNEGQHRECHGALLVDLGRFGITHRGAVVPVDESCAPFTDMSSS